MTREEQIREAALAYSFDTDGGCTGDLNTGRDDFMVGAEWADAHPANPWHKVADGDLPKESGDCLCYDGYETSIGWFDTSDNLFNSYSRFMKKIEVKYWMKVPKLPSERTT